MIKLIYCTFLDPDFPKPHVVAAGETLALPATHWHESDQADHKCLILDKIPEKCASVYPAETEDKTSVADAQAFLVYLEKYLP